MQVIITAAGILSEHTCFPAMYSVSHQYLFMADTIFEHLKYQLDQK
jgi:hypothetical protein